VRLTVATSSGLDDFQLTTSAPSLLSIAILDSVGDSSS